MKRKILDQTELSRKLLRIAYQVAEQHTETTELVILGIVANGPDIASYLSNEIKKILPNISIKLGNIMLNKENPLSEPITCSISASELSEKSILLVDDVANSGKTLFYACKPLLETTPKTIQLAVLVDRQHKAYPISPDFVGLSLSTTLLENISVEIENQIPVGAYLS